jgi:hypothetical protein
MHAWPQKDLLTTTLGYLKNIRKLLMMSTSKGKGKGVDWEATAEMLSSTSTAHPSQDDEADNYTVIEAVEAIHAATRDGLKSSFGLPTPA